jgi:hypothetical protein
VTFFPQASRGHRALLDNDERMTSRMAKQEVGWDPHISELLKGPESYISLANLRGVIDELARGDFGPPTPAFPRTRSAAAPAGCSIAMPRADST